MSEERQDKNSVFTSQHSQAPQVKNTNQIEIDVPVEIVPLPSEGKVYGVDHPLYMSSTVEITSMTAREEDILTSAAIIKKGTVVSELIKSCVTDKRIDPGTLLSGDRNALMVAIRATGYGVEYDGEITCGECGVTTNRSFNLGALPIRRLTIQPVVANENLFEFFLPRTKKVVHFKFLTGKIEEEIAIVSEKQKKLLNHAKDNHVTTSLLYTIVSVDGVTDRSKIARFVATIPASDSQVLRKYIRDNEPGVIMKQESTCPACGHEDEVVIPLTSTFLWPNTAG